MAIIGVLIRNSTAIQVGNYRSELQYDLGPRIEQRGHTVRYYDEQGTSGSDLTKRKIAMQMLDDMTAGVIQGIAAFDFKRLTRDEFGIDGGTIARRIVEAHGQFHTWDREYNLRLDDDLMQFQFQCFIAGLDWRNIRNTLWSGIFKKLEREPHYMKTPLGYMNVEDEHDKSHVAKNPDHQVVIDALARAFDECDTLSEAVHRLNTMGPARPAFRGRGGDSTRWHKFGLRYILRNTIYVGVFSFGARLKERSTVWDKFGLDSDGRAKDFEQYVPELAYWDAARVRMWRRKFDRPAQARTMKGGYKHPLAGVLECINCGSRMIGHGPGHYACSALGSGKGRGAVACSQPQILTDNVVLQILRNELPRTLADAQGLAERARNHLLERTASPTAQRLAFLEERAQSALDSIFDESTPKSMINRIKEKMAETETEIEALRAKIVEEEDARLSDEQLAATCDILLANPLGILDSMPRERQGRVYSMLFAKVHIETVGVGAGRSWRLRSYTARLIDEARVTDDAPFGRIPNPRAKLPEGADRSRLVFEATEQRTVAADISGRAYASYLGSLCTLAGVLSA